MSLYISPSPSIRHTSRKRDEQTIVWISIVLYLTPPIHISLYQSIYHLCFVVPRSTNQLCANK